ncbi:MAG: sn-glycerol-1-phosphate dehydrogenase [Gorillibacterium sp.]|nr:sn-glycerol-1-phosphate dehydrogenase [Gorillibacterium sp.]
MDIKARVEEMNRLAALCPCGNPHFLIHLEGSIASKAIQKVAPYLVKRGIKHVTVVADRHTKEAAANLLLLELANREVNFDLVILSENEQGDVAADEATLVEALLGIKDQSQAVLAVGSGTIHDIVRFASFKMKKSFISVPTAASVDGFVSAGAPLLIRGRKQTIQAASPDAIFADLDVLALAPREMTAAGYGDMLGKYTSLADWQFSHAAADEPFCPLAYNMTREALEDCVRNTTEIAAATPAGIRLLTEALIISGLSMQLVDHSRPASGAEHHLSHMWEMALLQQGRRQILHGAKVGVACIIISGLYEKLAMLAEDHEHPSSLQLFKIIPSPEVLRALLREAGGPISIGELGISRQLAEKALHTAHTIRDRSTGLRYFNEHELQIPLITGLEESTKEGIINKYV